MTTDQFNRTKTKYAMVDLGIGNIGTGNGITAKVPRGSVLVAAGVTVAEAFNSGGTTPVATVNVGDGTTDFVAAQDAKTAGTKTVANLGKFYPAGGEILFSLAESGAPLVPATEGRAVGYIAYLQLGTGCSIQE